MAGLPAPGGRGQVCNRGPNCPPGQLNLPTGGATVPATANFSRRPRWENHLLRVRVRDAGSAAWRLVPHVCRPARRQHSARHHRHPSRQSHSLPALVSSERGAASGAALTRPPGAGDTRRVRASPGSRAAPPGSAPPCRQPFPHPLRAKASGAPRAPSHCTGLAWGGIRFLSLCLALLFGAWSGCQAEPSQLL